MTVFLIHFILYEERNKGRVVWLVPDFETDVMRTQGTTFDRGPHRVGRVLSVSPVVGIGTPPPL
jgi:hypothetical protein